MVQSKCLLFSNLASSPFQMDVTSMTNLFTASHLIFLDTNKPTPISQKGSKKPGLSSRAARMTKYRRKTANAKERDRMKLVSDQQS